jgi:hypothetical protein
MLLVQSQSSYLKKSRGLCETQTPPLPSPFRIIKMAYEVIKVDDLRLALVIH